MTDRNRSNGDTDTESHTAYIRTAVCTKHLGEIARDVDFSVDDVYSAKTEWIDISVYSFNSIVIL